MNLKKFGLIVTLIYSGIVYIVNITVGLYAGIMAVALLIALLPFITPEERIMSISEMEAFGKMEI